MRAIVPLLIASFWMAGCAQRPQLRMWYADSLTKIFPDDRAGAGQVDKPVFHAARRSNNSIQIVLRSPDTLGDLYVDALPLTGPGMPIPSPRVRWVEYVVVSSNTTDTPEDELVRKAPALFPDAVLEAFPLTLQKNKTRSLWLTVRVPAGQAPGEYQGQIRLRQGRDAIAETSYRLVVHAATVPQPIPLAVTNHFNFGEGHIQQFYGISRYSPEWWDLMAGFARFLAGYHQTSIVADPSALATAEPAGSGVKLDFGNFERYIETFHSAGVRGTIEGGNLLYRERRRDAPIMVRAWVAENGRAARRDLKLEDPRAKQYLNTYLAALYARLTALGWTKNYLQSILDEPNPHETAAFVEVANLVRKLMPGVRTMEPVGAKQDLGFMEKTTDIWVPCLGSFDQKMDLLDNHRKSGGDLWYYTCLAPRGRYANRFIDYSLTKVRVLHWINFKYGFRGYLHWGGNYWGPDPYKDTQPVINEGRTYLPPGDAFITYPNRARRSLDSSIRLEQMREGIEDYGLLDELSRKDPERARKIVDQAVGSFTEYVREPAKFRAAQQALLEAF
jgi:hypothetical protein